MSHVIGLLIQDPTVSVEIPVPLFFSSFQVLIKEAEIWDPPPVALEDAMISMLPPALEEDVLPIRSKICPVKNITVWLAALLVASSAALLGASVVRDKSGPGPGPDGFGLGQPG